jgi:glycosyltransferase involved in cell wall biosynthesis
VTGESPAPGPNPPVVSVVLTTHATPAPLLAMALDSVLDQTLEDLEVVLVADGDLDEAAERLVGVLAAADPRLVVMAPGRVGRARALNLGIGTSRAPLVAIQDADDVSHPRRLEIQAALLDCMPQLAALAAEALVVDGPEAAADWELPGDALEVRILDREMLISNPVVHTSLVVRREALEAVGRYDERRNAQYDYDLLLRLRAAGHGVGRCQSPLVLRRRHAHQYFEGLRPVARAWSSCRLQLDHIAREPMPRRWAYRGVAAVRLGYQVGRGVAWHRSARQVTTGVRQGAA